METTTYKTKDIVLASTLVTLKFPVVSHEIEYLGSRPSNYTYFIFEDSPRLQDAIKKIENKLVVVEPYALCGNMRMLKSQCRQFQERNAS